MRSVEDMAHEYAVEILKTVHANHGYLSEFELENIAETAFGLAQAMQTELSKLNRGVPEAILEAEAEQLKAQLLCCQQESRGLVERVNRLEREKWEVLRGGGQEDLRGAND